MGDIVIRFGGKCDYLAIADIADEVQSIHADFRPDIYRRPEVTLEEERFVKLIEEGCLIVAEAAGIICGYTAFFTRISDNPLTLKRKVLYIDAMGIKQESRHKGIGSSMFSFLREYAERNDFDAVELTVLAQNSAAVGAYEKWGFGFKSYNMDMRLNRAE